MTQSGFIAALLLVGFVLFLADQNRLQTYAAVLWGPTSKPIPQPPAAVAAPGAAPESGGLLDALPGMGDVGPALLEAAPLLLG